MILTTDRIAILWCILFCFKIIVVAIFVLIFFCFSSSVQCSFNLFQRSFQPSIDSIRQAVEWFSATWFRFKPKCPISPSSRIADLNIAIIAMWNVYLFLSQIKFFCVFCLSVIYSLHFYYYTIIEFISILACWSRRCEANANEIPFD